MIYTLENGIQITYQPMPSALPEEFFAQVQADPKQAKERLEGFYKTHPKLPEIASLLTFVYIQLKEVKKAEALILETYKRHPTHLIAKINYADQCLRKKKKELIPAIFENTFDLFKLYPEKKLFHISEYRGFLVVMGFYHLAIKERAKAEEYHLLACRADLTHPSVMALEKKLFRFRLLHKFIRLQR